LILYYITDRTQFPGTEFQGRKRLLEKVAESARNRVDYIQLREKDLSGRDLEELALAAIKIIRENSGNSHTHLLVNSRVDVALAAGADGVHLRSEDISPAEVRAIWGASKIVHRDKPIVAVSCHNVAEVGRALEEKAAFAVFAPVFEKNGSSHVAGIAALRQACRQKVPVLALGGITLENASGCLDAGAAGIAAIRLFQENDISEVVRRFRACV
jgi:thiamine-phosphate pyrophosphorylase